jgi:flavin reductase (DIM6/NTAB) family NADH-FMN oxidoreductase RutF
MEFDPATLDPKASYRLFTSLVCPRPTFMLSVLGPDGAPVVGPFSYVNGVSSRPTVMMVAINPGRDGAKKFICTCIEERREFVLAVATPALLESPAPATRPAAKVKAPLLADSPLQMECALDRTVEVDGGTTVVLGRVALYHVADAAVTEGEVDPRAIPWVAQLGPDHSARVTDLFEKKRLPL